MSESSQNDAAVQGQNGDGSSRVSGCRGFWFQLPATFDEQEKNAGPEAEQHHGKAGGDAPKSADGRAAVVAAADDDVAGHGDEQFEDAAAQEPARGAFEQRLGGVGFGRAAEDDSPNEPEKNGDNEDADQAAPACLLRDGRLTEAIHKAVREGEHLEGAVREKGAEDRKNSRETEVRQKKRADNDGNF